MIDALIEKVWSNPALHRALNSLEYGWLQQALKLDPAPGTLIHQSDARRYIEAAGILACSSRADQQLVAYRMAVYTFDLFRGQLDGLDGSVRAVLTRLGNFPSLVTAPEVDAALTVGPWSIVEEEIARRAANEVLIAGKHLALTDFQKLLWSGLAAGNSLAIFAPTSTGKSFVLQAFISQKLTEIPLFSVCYVVPTRALITQVHADLTDALTNVRLFGTEVVTVPLEKDDVLPEKAVYVLTQERLQVLLKNHPTKKMDFLVIDEAHSVQDGDRGIILQSVVDELLIRNSAMQLLFASPTVSNLGIFGDMTGRGDIEAQSTDQVTVAQNFIDIEVTSATRGTLKIFARTADVRREVGSVQTGQTLASRVDCLVHIAHKFGAEKQSIVFADGQADAEKLAIQIADLRSLPDTAKPSLALEELAELAREAVHPKYVMALTVKGGVAFHYGNIPTILRNAVEQAFVSGEIHYIVCTSTLLAGVNLPARNLFMCNPQRKRGEPLGSVDFWNLAGRAGRLRREFQGDIFMINYAKWKVQPLSGLRLSEITPAIEGTIHKRADELKAVIINDQEDATTKGDIGLETIFVRLLADFKRGRIGPTLDRAKIARSAPLRSQLEQALAAADKVITLPVDVLNASPTISAHRQQRLYDIFDERIRSHGESGGRNLLPGHPREPAAFDSYVAALALCHNTIIRKPGTDKQNRFFALIPNPLV